jgi:hypothetical protein
MRNEVALATRIAALLGLLATFVLAAPAFATSCTQWQRLGPDQKAATVDDMIESAISGSGGRSYKVNRGAVERCLERSSRNIEYAFDDVCSDGRTASMNAIRTTFKDYIWNCAG